MNILLKGGPLDGQTTEALTDDYGNPLELADFPPPLTMPRFLGAELSPDNVSVEILRYKLVETRQDKSIRYFEYHYQGR